MMTKRLAFFIFVINIINVINGNFPLPAITPEYCNATEFYDPICVRCKRCGGKDETQASLQHRGPDGKCNVKCNRVFYNKRSIFRLLNLGKKTKRYYELCILSQNVFSCDKFMRQGIILVCIKRCYIISSFYSVFIFYKPLKNIFLNFEF